MVEMCAAQRKKKKPAKFVSPPYENRRNYQHVSNIEHRIQKLLNQTLNIVNEVNILLSRDRGYSAPIAHRHP